MGCVVSSVSCKVCRVSVCPVSCVVWAWGETRNDLCAFILLLYFTFESGCASQESRSARATPYTAHTALSGVRGQYTRHHTAHQVEGVSTTHLAGCVTAKALQTRTRLTLLSAHTRLHTPQPRHTARTHARCAARALQCACESSHATALTRHSRVASGATALTEVTVARQPGGTRSGAGAGSCPTTAPSATHVVLQNFAPGGRAGGLLHDGRRWCRRR